MELYDTSSSMQFSLHLREPCTDLSHRCRFDKCNILVQPVNLYMCTRPVLVSTRTTPTKVYLRQKLPNFKLSILYVFSITNIVHRENRRGNRLLVTVLTMTHPAINIHCNGKTIFLFRLQSRNTRPLLSYANIFSRYCHRRCIQQSST